MSRFYVPRENVGQEYILIEGRESKHILDVMRLREGDKVAVFDGTGTEYNGFIENTDIRSKKVVIKIVSTEKPAKDSMPEITLAQAVPKKGKMDYIVEKLTELGVSNIIPMITERTIVRPDDSASEKKVERWQRIALGASKQCGRTNVPEIRKISGFEDVVDRMDRYDLAVFACLSDKTNSVKETLSDIEKGRIIVFIGPEGGFTESERQKADRDNCRFVSLGSRVLKSDTAGLFVLSVLNYKFAL